MSEFGSEWRKWDLHVHTPESRPSLGDWPTFVEALIDSAREHQVSAIGTADYFTINGYKRLLEYYDQHSQKLTIKGKSAELFVVPGVELRLNTFNSKGDSINLHVLFDPKCCSTDFITQNFLEQLTIEFRGTKIHLNPQGILAFGKAVDEGSKLNIGEDFSSVPENMKVRYRNTGLRLATLSYQDINEALEEIDKIFERHKISSKSYLICVAGKGHGGLNALDWFEKENSQTFSRAGLLREHLTHGADAIFSNSQDDRKFYLGEHEGARKAEIETRFRGDKPCIWGCDANGLSDLLKPNGKGHDYTWIKSDLSFDGLKQITYEPELRVVVQRDSPKETVTYAKIDSLEVDLPNDLVIRDQQSKETMPFCLRGKKNISFSPNLTCVIGGRGSGKSTVIHLLFNSMPKSDTARLLNLNSPLSSLQWGVKDELGTIASLSKCTIPVNTEFFLQNEVEKFAKDISEMSTLIRTRLFGLSGQDDSRKMQRLEVEWQAASVELDKLIEAFDNITRVNEEVRATVGQRDTLKAQTEVISSSEYKALQKDIETIATAISNFEGFEKEYGKVTAEITALSKSVSKLDWTKYDAQDSISGLISDLSTRQAAIDAAFRTAKSRFEAEDYSGKSGAKKMALRSFLSGKGFSSENIGELAAANDQIANLEQRIRGLKSERANFDETYSRRDEILSSYRSHYESFKEEYEAAAGRLQSSLSELKVDNQQALISFLLRTNVALVKQNIADFIKASNDSKVSLRSDHIQTVIFPEAQADNILRVVENPRAFIDSINNSEDAEAHTQVLREMANRPTFVEKVHLRLQKFYYDIHNIQIQTKLGDKALQNTSFGERCGIVIAIALVTGTNPIVIDQPEDNLDGRYISTVLVPLIRRQKLRRQIILVTRDANIVIGADAELILILDKEQAGTVLKPATIENQNARELYIWILDGGEEAFQKREARYSIARKV